MITADDVHRLLSSAEPDAALVLLEGRTEVLSGVELETDRYRGALWVTSREELVGQGCHADMSDRELAEQAANLDAAVTNLGG